MNVQGIMAKDPATCTRDTSLRDVARLMVEKDCGMIPVLDERGIPIGTVTDRDIACRTVAQGRNPLELSASDCMTNGCVTCRMDASVEECADLLEEHQVRRAIVVDEGGRCCGIVALADIALNERDLAGETVAAVSEPSQPSAMH